jgi:uncharacterized protein YrrD
MLIPITHFHEFPVMSLQTGSQLASLGEPIIDPRKLTVVAFYVTGPQLDEAGSLLHVTDIRELSDIGAIVDSSDSLMAPDGLVRLQEIIDFNFKLIGTKVEDEHGHHLGKVDDFALEAETYSIQQIYTKPSLLSSFTATTNIIHRNQIVSVTNEKIVVKSPTITENVQQAAGQAFVNPFRGTQQPNS